MVQYVTCTRCHGTGEFEGETCGACDGDAVQENGEDRVYFRFTVEQETDALAELDAVLQTDVYRSRLQDAFLQGLCQAPRRHWAR